VAYHNPIPETKQPSLASSGMREWVEAEKLINLALVLPSAVLIGWGTGWWLDHALHQKWITVVGIIFGCVAGLVVVVRQAVAAEKKTSGSGTVEHTDKP
jgi:F0F1-type ATP synthase assembly protein I